MTGALIVDRTHRISEAFTVLRAIARGSSTPFIRRAVEEARPFRPLFPRGALTGIDATRTP